MGFWGRLLTAFVAAAPPSPVLVHLRAMRSVLVDLRRAVALSEAILDARLARARGLESELRKWERRLGADDAELRERTERVVDGIRASLEAAQAGIAESREAVASGEDQLQEASVGLVLAKQKATAYGMNTDGVDLDSDEVLIRREASATMARVLPDEPQDEERVFLETLWARKEQARSVN
jgi:hypothetical protein